ncbi:MAG TPA: carbon-nitrogen hydrolase family protein, partial [Phycicoccus sp.]|nr:carbon-nitrogen hydrolase family protein [Phycicoccus sp.]
MRAFTAAAVQIAPVPGPLTAESVTANLDKCVDFVRRCVESTGAELIVLPESATTGFTPGIATADLWEFMTELPASGTAEGTIVAPLAEAARELGVHVVVGTYERGPSPEVVYNSSVLIDPAGEVLGVYRKTHPFCSEIVSGGGWVTPGDTVTVCDTELGKIGMIICFDGDYPELSRIQAVQGAEVIARPSALLRSAD